MGDRAAAEKWEITTRSLRNWRLRLGEDDKLAAIFQRKRAQKDAQWASEIPAALSAAIAFIKESAVEGDRRDAEHLAAVTKAAEALSDIALTWKVMDERLSQTGNETEKVG